MFQSPILESLKVPNCHLLFLFPPALPILMDQNFQGLKGV